MASPAFVQTSTATASNQSSSPYAPAYPAGMTTGNFLVMVANIVFTAGTGVVTPSGFTEIGPANGSLYDTIKRVQVFWRRIDGSEGSAASLAFSGTIYPQISFFEFSGVVASPTSPIDGTPAFGTIKATPNGPNSALAYTTATAATTLFDFIVATGSLVLGSVAPGRGTSRAAVFFASGGQSTAVASKALASSGTEAAADWTFGGGFAGPSQTFTFAIASLAPTPPVTFVPQIVIM